MMSLTKFYDITQNYIVDMMMWPKFGNASISMEEVIMNSIV